MAESKTPIADLSPAELDIIGVRAGDKNEMNITLKQNGEAVDVTSMTLKAQARQKATDIGDAPLTAVITKIDSPAGKINVRWPGAQVAAVLGNRPEWKGVWDLQQKTGTDDPVTMLAGDFQIVPDVSR